MRSILSRVVIAIAIVAALTANAAAEPELAASDRAEIRAVIEAQLDAFRADDGVTAFSYASPTIQRIFDNPKRFMTMVKTSYQPVYRPREVEFQDVIEVRGALTQLVLLVGPDNQVVTAFYEMEQQADGAWRASMAVFSVHCPIAPLEGWRHTHLQQPWARKISMLASHNLRR